MCHHLKWEDWELLQDEEQREEEPRVIEVPSGFEPEPEPEPEREPERVLIRA